MSDDEDKEFDPEHPVLRFGMSESERKELERRIKANRKKLSKRWKPEGH